MNLSDRLHPAIAARKEKLRAKFSDPGELKNLAIGSIAGLREPDPFYFFKGFTVDGKTEALSIYGYLCFQQLLSAIEFGGFALSDLGTSEAEIEKWASQCKEVDENMARSYWHPYHRGTCEEMGMPDESDEFEDASGRLPEEITEVDREYEAIQLGRWEEYRGVERY